MFFSLFFFKQKTAYEMRISDWSSDVCSSDLDALRRGFQQYVILGAGMDTFCHRRPDLVSDLRVIEVDLPASQQMKRERLAAAGLQPGRNVAYCPIDLERDDLAEALCQAGLDRSRPTFFSWLGVSPYLTRAA